MKVNKDFAVIVNGKRFEAFDIKEIHINGGEFKMICMFGKEAEITVECRTRDVEFVSIPGMPELPKPKCTNCRVEVAPLKKYEHAVGDEPASDIEIASPLGTVRRAVDEAIKEAGNTPKTIQVGLNINGEQFAKVIKPGDSIRDSRPETMIAAFDKVGAATKELNERFNALRNSIEALNRVATEALKKYDNTGGD